MSLLSKIIPSPGRGKSYSDAPAGSSSSMYSWGLSSLAGEVVSPASAAQLAAVFCAVKILSETIGMVSLDMYSREDGIIKTLPKHPLQFRLHDEPNSDQTAMEWREQMTGSLALWGNAFSRKIIRGSRLAGLEALSPQAMSVRKDRGDRVFRYYPLDGAQTPEDFTSKEILHIRTLSWNGLEGVSPISQVRNAFGLAMALERYGSRFFANGAFPGGVLIYPGTVDSQMNRNIRESWKKLYAGGDNAYEIGVLEEGMKYQQVGVDPEKAQAMEARRFQIAEVARVFRIPLHMLYDMAGTTNSNIEEQSMGFVTYTLMPWIVRWEQALNRSLLTEEEKGRVFCGFDLSDLLRGDMESRYKAHAIARQWGWESANDVLRAEKKNPRTDPEGNAYLSPLNMVSYGEDGMILPPGGDSGNGTGRTPANIPGAPGSTAVSTLPVSPGKAREIHECALDIASTARRVSRLIARDMEEAA